MGVKLTSNTKHFSEGWGMGFLLVFFPDDDHQQPKPNTNNLRFLSSIRPNHSWPNCFLHKAQSTISICLLLLLLLCTTLLLLTLSPLPSAAAPRRRLRESLPAPPILPHALQGMGALYRRGTRAMNDVVLAHAHGPLSPNELKLFLRLFLRSALASKSDLVFIFPAKTARLDGLILREQKSFDELLARYGSSNESSGFDVTHFASKERESAEPIWGQKNRTNRTESEDSNRPSYGSVVGFDVDELDPENSLSGFLDHVPMSLRRWACYPMLLGRVRRNYKHAALVDINDILLLGDPLARVRSRGPETVLLNSGTSQSNPSKRGRRNSDKTESTTRGNPAVHPGIVVGGARGVRRLSSAMLTDIVRGSMNQHKKMTSSVTESGVLNQLVGKEYTLKNVNLMVSTEALPELGRKSGSHLFTKNYGLIKRGNSNLEVVNSMVMKHICSFPIDSLVYSDC